MSGGLISSLNMGGRALSNFSTAIDVTGNNIANSSTVGYHRQSVSFVSGPARRAWGQGAFLGGVGRSFNRFTENQLSSQTTTTAGYDLEAKSLAMVNGTFNESTTEGLGAAFDEFYSAMATLVTDPGTNSVRTSLLGSAEKVTTRFHSLSKNLDYVRGEMDYQIDADVSRVNELVMSIADINKRLAGRTEGDSAFHNLRDQQAIAMEELAQYVPMNIQHRDDGQVNIMVGGRALVEGNEYHQLATVKNEDNNNHLDVVFVGQDGAEELFTSALTGGTIGKAIETRDVTVKGYEDDLDDLAFEFATRLNEVHEVGYGLDAVDGRKLFDIPDEPEGAARLISISADVEGNPAAIAAALVPDDLPGDNTNAILLYETSAEAIAGLGETSFQNFYTNLSSQVGQDYRLATEQHAIETGQLYEISSLRESQSGVNLDEEAAELQKFEAAYQAAARYISTVNEMLDTLMQMGR